MTRQITQEHFVTEPYEMLPLQDFISSLEKGDKKDEFGNPYYYVTIDHRRLADALKGSQQQVINCSLNFGKIPIRIGYTLREGQTKNVDEGWSGSEYDGDNPIVNNDGTITYGFPPIAIESAYRDEASLHALQEFSAQLPDKTIVVASGNSSGEVPESFQMPENVVMVAAWDSDLNEQKPKHDFFGKPGTVYYADSAITNGLRKSSFATAMVSEWLCEHEVPGPKQAKTLLDQHSKIKIHGDWQVLDIGLTHAGNRDWENQQKYKPTASNN